MPKRDWYEFEIGLYVEAESPEEAWEKLAPLVELANSIDPEGNAQIQEHGTWGGNKDA